MRLTMETRIDRKGREYYFIKSMPAGEWDFNSFMSATVFPHPNAFGYAVYIWWQRRTYIWPDTVGEALAENTPPQYRYNRWVKRYLVEAKEDHDIWTDTTGVVHTNTRMVLTYYHPGVAVRMLDKIMHMVDQNMERWSDDPYDWHNGWISRGV